MATNVDPTVLYSQMVRGGESFRKVVYSPFMVRDVKREDVRELLRIALSRTAGSYRHVMRLFNVPLQDQQWFMDFLRKYDLLLDHKPFRSVQKPLHLA